MIRKGIFEVQLSENKRTTGPPTRRELAVSRNEECPDPKLVKCNADRISPIEMGRYN
jgi:hypothetical protein